eukprot:ANDGO_05931.mRNA.1 DNA-directed RNA polymerase I subunit rpa2
MVRVGPTNDTAIRATQNERLMRITEPHVDSFNFFLEHGLSAAVSDLDDVEIENAATSESLRMWIEEIKIGRPTRDESGTGRTLYPHECREAGLSYRAPMIATVCRQVNDGNIETMQRKLGMIPIMVKSSKCHLHGLSPRELVTRREDENEMGGYFIIHGLEKCIRLTISGRRNHPMAMARPSFERRGPKFTKFGVLCRSVRPDQTSVNNLLHYLTTGEVLYGFTISKQQFFIPVVLMLKAMKNCTDAEIFDHVVAGQYSNTFLTERVELVLEEARSRYPNCNTQAQCLAFLGSRFRSRLRMNSKISDLEAGIELLRKNILVHLLSGDAKYDFGILMLRKLFSLVGGQIMEDSSDSPMNQEVLLPGHIYLAVVKERLEDYLESIKIVVNKDLRQDPSSVRFSDSAYIRRVLDKNSIDLGRKLEYFLATGNFQSRGSLGIVQSAGFVIVAEKLNFYRYLSHFRSIHRGQVFTEMKTTSVRKLLPDSWGFLCPVHTPDGAPCGLLNHLAHEVRVSPFLPAEVFDGTLVDRLLVSLGMISVHGNPVPTRQMIPVLLDGRLLGHIDHRIAKVFVDSLRFLKCLRQNPEIPDWLEIAYIPQVAEGSGPFAGIYLFSSPARMMRPVRNMAADAVEWIGTLEQIYLDIACIDADVIQNLTTHKEILPTHMLSVVANLTPFSDFNQSPRNMYQCQMGKQTMGSACHNYPYRTDNKMYRILFPQTPLARTRFLDAYGFDDYPMGTNCCVAVISYTGYDMEDAMIINKGAYDRGLFHGAVYTTTEIDLALEKKGEPNSLRFSNRMSDVAPTESGLVEPTLDVDGLPMPGTPMKQGDPFYVVYDSTRSSHKVIKYKYAESSTVQEVRIIPMDKDSPSGMRRVSIKLRFNRNPVLGDKFSSRHGQKGTLAQVWPQENMPFTDAGITPDVLINPNAFPSRMTIGMLIESMAGKAGSLHGVFQDATPFQFDETEHRAIEYFGDQLAKAGFHYYGNETMYSGTLGVELTAEIYMGVVFYQRLRHMVKDKFQVRSTGPIHDLTHQPIKGRKLGGGIRFGEMERDSLLGHGVSYWLQDRLLHCSDEHREFVCKRCHSFLGVASIKPVVHNAHAFAKRRLECVSCKANGLLNPQEDESDSVDLIQIPYVFKYLVNELAAMNIRVILDTPGNQSIEPMPFSDISSVQAGSGTGANGATIEDRKTKRKSAKSTEEPEIGRKAKKHESTKSEKKHKIPRQ